MPSIPQIIHDYVHNRRSEHMPVSGRYTTGTHKEYPRMEQFVLPQPEELPASLSEALKNRSSINPDIPVSGDPISLKQYADLLGNALKKHPGANETSRPYPSGGALFPIETYLIASGISEHRSGFHYNPTTHSLEKLWDVPEPISEFLYGCDWAQNAPALIILTSVWKRNWHKYGDFGYYLAMLEAGHMGQNILLCATALDLHARPIGGFSAAKLEQTFDLDSAQEQAIYTIVLGH